MDYLKALVEINKIAVDVANYIADIEELKLSKIHDEYDINERKIKILNDLIQFKIMQFISIMDEHSLD